MTQQELLELGASLRGKAREWLRLARGRLRPGLHLLVGVRQLLLVLHTELLHVMHMVKPTVGPRVLVARLLNLLCNYRLRCITLHATIHEI